MSETGGNPNETPESSNTDFDDPIINNNDQSDFDTLQHGSKDEYNEEEEAKHFAKVAATFRQYEKLTNHELFGRLKMFKRLPQKRQSRLVAYEKHLADLKRCARRNQQFLTKIISRVDNIFENVEHKIEEENLKKASQFNLDKLRSTLRQFVRDWSSDGAEERKSSYGPILQDLRRLFPENPENYNILVPGAGLGRLAYEIAKMGFKCEGNEISLFMLFGSNYILNYCSAPNTIILHPWIHQWSNNFNYEDQTRPVLIPDQVPNLPDSGSRFSMTAGDFRQIYSRSHYANSFDSIVTVFFLDTALDLEQYLRVIDRVLKPGGYWINLGPLLYHYPDDKENEALQLPYEEIRRIIVDDFKFELIDEQMNLRTSYAQNERSMLKYEYDCIRFIGKKSQPITTTDSGEISL